MTEADFQRAIVARLSYGRRVLRASDVRDARRGVYGLRACTLPNIASTGADLLVMPTTGIPCVLARSREEVEAALATHDGPFFLELKEPGRRARKDQTAQESWMRWVSGGRA